MQADIMENDMTDDIFPPVEQTADIDMKWLTFWLEGQLFAVPITIAEQIIGMQPITEIPEYPYYAKGIINLRGIIVPLVDLRLLFGKPEAEYTDHTCIIIAQHGEKQMGFIVDTVDAVLDINPGLNAPPPDIHHDHASQYLTGIARVPGDNNTENIVLCLDMTKLIDGNDLSGLFSV